jgi:hypothetical protein
MNGRNSIGRRVSLLNDDTEWTRPHVSLPFHSRASSFASAGKAPSDPPTPQLIRSDSTDSGALQRTPSPLTPTSNYSPSQAQFYASEMYPYPTRQKQQPPLATYDADLTSHQRRSSNSAPSKGRPSGPVAKDAPTSKNRYPCPVAKKYNCSDYFTTSGHAARHAKKHTGRKDSFCPECNKAFTRKDNMEQHRRTHQNGRKASKDVDAKRLSKVSPAAVETTARLSTGKTSKPLPIQASLSRDVSQLSPQAAYAPYSEPMHLAPDASSYPADPLVNSAYALSPYPALNRTLSGLDTLAYAAHESLRRSPPGY